VGHQELESPACPPPPDRQELKVDKLHLVRLYERVQQRADELIARLAKEKAKDGK